MTRLAIRSETAGRDNAVWYAISCTHSHSRRSSSGRLQSAAALARLALTTSSSSLGDGASGTSYWPSARSERWPATDPTCQAVIAGNIAAAH